MAVPMRMVLEINHGGKISPEINHGLIAQEEGLMGPKGKEKADWIEISIACLLLFSP